MNKPTRQQQIEYIGEIIDLLRAKGHTVKTPDDLDVLLDFGRTLVYRTERFPIEQEEEFHYLKGPNW